MKKWDLDFSIKTNKSFAIWLCRKYNLDLFFWNLFFL